MADSVTVDLGYRFRSKADNSETADSCIVDVGDALKHPPLPFTEYRVDTRKKLQEFCDALNLRKDKPDGLFESESNDRGEVMVIFKASEGVDLGAKEQQEVYRIVADVLKGKQAEYLKNMRAAAEQVEQSTPQLFNSL